METYAWPRVAVVVVNLNGAAVLDRCLDALERQTVRPTRVLVVDNASTDGSVDGLEDSHPGVEVLRLPKNIGFAAGNNRAVELADDCEWVALLNPDAFAEPQWLEELLSAARDEPGFAFFASQLVDARDPARLDGAGDVLHVSGVAWRRGHGEPVASAPEGGEVFGACAAAALYRRDAFVAAGGFDERFFCYLEDVDLAFRLRLAGHRCLYVPTAVVHHLGSALTGRESAFTVFHRQRNLVWTYVKDMPLAPALRHLPQLALAHALMVGWHVLSGRAGAAVRSELSLLAGLPRMLRARRGLQRARTVSAAELEATLEHGLGGYLTAFARARTARSTSAATASAGAGNT